MYVSQKEQNTYAGADPGGPRGPCPPPQKIAPPNSQARIQGAKRALPPPGGPRGPCPPLQNPGSAYDMCALTIILAILSPPPQEKLEKEKRRRNRPPCTAPRSLSWRQITAYRTPKVGSPSALESSAHV